MIKDPCAHQIMNMIEILVECRALLLAVVHIECHKFIQNSPPSLPRPLHSRPTTYLHIC